MILIRPVDALWGLLCRVVRRRCVSVAMSCTFGLLCGLVAHADVVVPTSAIVQRPRSASICALPGPDDGAMELLRDMSARLSSIALPGLSPNVTSQLWMGVPLTMRAFVLPRIDASINGAVVARLARAQPLLRDLAVTNDGFMLVGHDRDAQWAAHWQIVNGRAQGWLSLIALRSPGHRAEAGRQIRSVMPSWLSANVRMMAHYLTDAHTEAPRSQGIWQIMQPASQAAQAIAKGLIQDGWVSQSSTGGRWRRGSCALDFRVFDSGVGGSGSDALPIAHSLLWVFLRQVPI